MISTILIVIFFVVMAMFLLTSNTTYKMLLGTVAFIIFIIEIIINLASYNINKSLK